MTRCLGLTALIAGLASAAFAGTFVAPEVDATSAAAAIALVGGGLLILRSRKKK
jgi:LPXTG-motif cell wall-anchored protein